MHPNDQRGLDHLSSLVSFLYGIFIGFVVATLLMLCIKEGSDERIVNFIIMMLPYIMDEIPKRSRQIAKLISKIRARIKK